MRRAALLVLISLLAACASVIGARTVSVPLVQMQEQVARSFPKQQRLLSLFDVRLSAPRLSLDPASESLRLVATLDVSQSLSGKRWQGELALKGRLALDRQRQQLRLSELRPAGLTIGGRGSIDFASEAPYLERLSEYLARDLVLHQFQPDELRRLGLQFQPIALRVAPDHLALTFEAK